jgi:dienelactone hydrolase
VAERDLERDDPLDDFRRREVTLVGRTRAVYVDGAGPAVVVMAEMPGISPRVARFARWVREAGFTVWLPSLFGRDGAAPTAGEGRRVMERACVAGEFRALAANESSPVTAWLRALAALAHRECGGASTTRASRCSPTALRATRSAAPSASPRTGGRSASASWVGYCLTRPPGPRALAPTTSSS